MKVLVTGSAGFIGSHLVSKLLRDGHEVRCLMHKENINNHSEKFRDIMFVYGDITNQKSLENAVKDIDVVFHLAAKVQTGYYQDEDKLMKVNFHGTCNLISAVVANNSRLQNFVYLSSAGAIGMFDSKELIKEDVECLAVTDYGMSKLLAEKYLGYSGYANNLPYTIIRPPTVYGIRERYNLLLMSRAIKNRRFALIGSGNNLTSVCHISNLIDALILVGFKASKNQTYHVADDKPITWNHLTEIISKQLNISKPIHLPVWICKDAAIGLESVSRITKKDPILHQGRIHTMTDNFALDITKIKNEGYNPKVTTEDGIAQTIQWYKEQCLL
jgi:nucleoside-diphosphate-sugar epimerase